MLKARTEAGTQIRAEENRFEELFVELTHTSFEVWHWLCWRGMFFNTNCLKPLYCDIIANSIFIEVAHSFNLFLFIHLFPQLIFDIFLTLQRKPGRPLPESSMLALHCSYLGHFPPHSTCQWPDDKSKQKAKQAIDIIDFEWIGFSDFWADQVKSMLVRLKNTPGT